VEVDFDAIELGEAPFGEAPEGFNAVNVSAAIGEGLALIYAHVLVVTDVDQTIVPWPTIRADHALGIDPAPNHGAQGGLAAVVNDFSVNFAGPLEDAKDGLLGGASTAQARPGTSSHSVRPKVTLIHFHHSLKRSTLAHSLQPDEQPKPVIKPIDGLAIEFQQQEPFVSQSDQDKNIP